MAYSEKVLDHYENPRNVGTFNQNDPDVGTGMVGAPACGDVMKLQIKVSAAGIIEDAKFKTYGCSGMAYKLEFVDQAAPDDLIFTSNGVNVLVVSDLVKVRRVFGRTPFVLPLVQ